MKTKSIFIIIGLAILGVFSCKKDQTIAPNNATGILYFHLHTNIDSNEVAVYDSVYSDANGRNFSLNLAQLYISGITLRKTDGSVVNLNNVVVLKTLDQEVYMLGNVPAGNYLNVSFDCGLGETQNSRNPNDFATNHPLANQNPPMWFGDTTQGYMFVNLSGKLDTSASGTGAPTVPFHFKIGSNALLKHITFTDEAFTVPPDESATVHISCDYAALWSNLDWKKDTLTDTYQTRPDLAFKIAGNIPKLFKKGH